MTMVRDLGPMDRFQYLASLGLSSEAIGRLDVLGASIDEPGIFIEAETGESRLLQTGEQPPAGVWIAQRELDAIKAPGAVESEARGFGEGWGSQREQITGDRSYPEEDAGGTRRVAHSDDLSESDLPPG